MCTKARTMKRQILLLRGLAILAVVAHHAAAWGFVAMFWWTHRYTTTSVPDYSGMGSPAYWLLMVPNQAALFSVPAFLFISGLSAAYSVGTGPLRGDWRIVRARLGAIIGPYLVWSLVMFAIDAALGVRLSPAEYLGRLLIGRAVDAYYFVPLLVQFYLVSPLVVRGVRSRPWAVLGVAAALQAACTLLPYLGFSTVTAAGTRVPLVVPAWLLVQWPVYYVLGTIVGAHPRQASRVLNRLRAPLIALTATLGVLTLLESEVLWRLTADWDWAHGNQRLSSGLYALAFVLLATTWRIRPTSLTRAVGRAGALSYGIYLMHPKALELSARAVYHLAPGLLSRQVPFVMLLFAVPLAGCWLAMTLMARSPARRVYHVVFG